MQNDGCDIVGENDMIIVKQFLEQHCIFHGIL